MLAVSPYNKNKCPFYTKMVEGYYKDGYLVTKMATWKKVVFHEELDKTCNDSDMICTAVVENVRVES